MAGAAELAKARVSGADLRHAVALQQQGRLAEASAACEAVLAHDAERFDALHLLGMVRLGQNRPDAALPLLERAVALLPDAAAAHYHLAHAQRRLGRLEEVIESYRRALAARPDFAEALFNLGHALRDRGRREEAIACYRRFLELRSGVAAGHRELADTLQLLGRHQEAVQSYQQAVALEPDLALAHNNLGIALRALGQSEEALAGFRRAVQLAPGHAAAHDNLGAVLADLGRHEEALASHREALRLQPDLANAHYNLGCALAGAGRHEEALAALRTALERQPERGAAHHALGQLLWNLDRPDEAIPCLERALALEPERPYLAGTLAYARRQVCRWATYESDARALAALVQAGQQLVHPFVLLAFCDDPAAQHRCATRHVRRHEPLTIGPRPARPDGRIRLGYLSADYRSHPVSRLAVELMELHDRQRFEVHGLSYGPDDGSALRRRIVGAFDRFHDLQSLGHRQAAEAIAAAGIDIVVDLGGHSFSGRPAILAHRPAPLQVNYLGYPGTMGADFIDYILVDRFLVPPDRHLHFSEQLVHLPESYQVNDRRRAIDQNTPTRAECGLPEQGFVFCAFNASFKVTPAAFAVWMRLLEAVPGSVLWLLRRYAAVEANLRREAAARGVDPDRLVFAPSMPQPRHLARQRLADLFLDNLPYSAHTTASDALWVGLPVLTCAGRSFAGRVAGSLLRAVGLPELVTTSLEEYEALALTLAHEPARLAALRDRLARNRATMPLFDTDRQRGSIERAYLEMWRRHERGLPPAAFVVPPEAAR